jgi:uncharacterized protein YndB with AHSA1/START domain
MTDRIEKTIELKATLERVWRALTDAEQFGQWFRVKLDGPFTPGEESVGRVLYPGYEHVTWRCRTVAIEPMTRFAFTWHPYAIDPETDYAQEPPTLVEFRLEPTAGGVRLLLTESGFDALPPRRREEAFPRNEGGWTIQIQNIRDYVEA